jgi:peptide deformylase
MALRNIITDEDPQLRKVSRPVERFDARLAELIEDMLETMETNNGIGLAAVQVGILRRVFVMDINDGEGPYVLVNPKIIEEDGEQVGQEGCLSVPGRWGDVKRPARVIFEAQDKDGKTFQLEADGLLAVCACHEYDHLDGILFKDKVIGELESSE